MRPMTHANTARDRLIQELKRPISLQGKRLLKLVEHQELVTTFSTLTRDFKNLPVPVPGPGNEDLHQTLGEIRQMLKTNAAGIAEQLEAEDADTAVMSAGEKP